MDAFDRVIRRAARREREEIPPAACERIRKTLAGLPEGTGRRRTQAAAVLFSGLSNGSPRIGKRILAVSAAAALLFVAIPNFSPQAAAAMRELPVLGPLVEVILVRNYLYEDKYHSADIAVPEVTIEAESGSELEKSVQEINNEVKLLTQRLIREFEDDVAQIGEGGHTETDLYYRTVTNNSGWFTLEILVYYGSGSGSASYRYYHIDKTTGQTRQLSDLFTEGSGYVEAISNWILARMREEAAAGQAVYWIDKELEGGGFHAIKEDQNFFFAENGNLVIQFDEYEVAPGSSGTPRFEIPREVYEEYLKERY